MAMIETIHWHTLHPRYLSPESVVLDLGANHGYFAKAITDRFHCRYVAVEPSPGPFATIPASPLIIKLPAAVSDKSGTVPFNVSSDFGCKFAL
jgi:FkbM family methyltransferase